ncbi:MAG: tyrosine-type recombinase/integrase [Lachnospiraceae bacterium]|jgi:integrase|nr:tyrosine-type recombinase/integrase [Lachnospiraceae bacterium]
MSTTQPVRNKHHVRALAEHCLKRGEYRNHLLVVMGTHTALRVSDLLRLTWDDVYDFDRRRVRESVTVTEGKTGKSKSVRLNKAVVAALRLCLPAAVPGGYLLKSRKGANRAISRIQAYRIIAAAAKALSLDGRVSCHSLRKTFGYHAWKNGISPAVIMEIYNHSSYAVTRQYLGITQDDKDEVYCRLAEVV